MPGIFEEMEKILKLNRAGIQEIRNNSLLKRYKKGAMIIAEDDPADGLYIILEGHVKVYQISENGKEKTLTIIGVGSFIGEMAAFGQHIRSASVKALDSVTVLKIPQQKFEMLLKEIPGFGLQITEIITERLRRTNRQFAQLIHLNSRAKVLCQLQNLAEHNGRSHQKGIIIPLRLTHGDIASLAGVARETVTKVLRELEGQGVIAFEKRQMIIHSLERLQKEMN